MGPRGRRVQVVLPLSRGTLSDSVTVTCGPARAVTFRARTRARRPSIYSVSDPGMAAAAAATAAPRGPPAAAALPGTSPALARIDRDPPAGRCPGTETLRPRRRCLCRKQGYATDFESSWRRRAWR